VVYQEAAGARRYIPARFRLQGGVVSFDLGPYGRRRALVIDPVLTYATTWADRARIPTPSWPGIDLNSEPKLFVACVLMAPAFWRGNEGFFPLGTVAPGEIVSIFGAGLGPDQPVTANFRLGDFGTWPTTMGGTQVLFDGVPAPMLYASANQINAVVPYEVKRAGHENDGQGRRRTGWPAGDAGWPTRSRHLHIQQLGDR